MTTSCPHSGVVTPADTRLFTAVNMAATSARPNLLAGAVVVFCPMKTDAAPLAARNTFDHSVLSNGSWPTNRATRYETTKAAKATPNFAYRAIITRSQG